MEMVFFRFLCTTILISILYPCESTEQVCTKFNNGNIQEDFNSADDFFDLILKPIADNKLFPVFNNDSVPDVQNFIEQFQLGKANADVSLNITQLLTKYGYPVEQHQATTEDGYCLGLFRIPRPKAPVIFLMHGVLCSADDFVTPGTKTALAYALYDAGYDVWLGNARGNKHSRCHRTISPECAEFWKFSFDEIGRYDIPTMIDYVLETTGKCQLGYVGHSQGTTSFYVMASERPEYNKKISFMVCLSAVVFMSNVRSPGIQVVSPFRDAVEDLAKLVGYYEVLPREAFLSALTSTFCGSPELAEIFCQFFIFVGSGFDYPQINPTVLPVIYGHYPGGSSIYQLIHYAQGVTSGKFRNYDYGPIINLEKYGSLEPPDYPLEKVTCPMAIFYSNNDWLTSAPDIVNFLEKVENVREFYHVPCASFMHFDYLYAKDADVLVNREILRLFKKYINE